MSADRLAGAPAIRLSPEEHRRAAVDLFNFAWTLLDKQDRTADEDDTMVHAAHASRFHWGQVGTQVNLARGEWQVSRVYAVLGRAEPALWHARRCLEHCRGAGGGDFDLASGGWAAGPGRVGAEQKHLGRARVGRVEPLRRRRRPRPSAADRQRIAGQLVEDVEPPATGVATQAAARSRSPATAASSLARASAARGEPRPTAGLAGHPAARTTAAGRIGFRPSWSTADRADPAWPPRWQAAPTAGGDLGPRPAPRSDADAPERPGAPPPLLGTPAAAVR